MTAEGSTAGASSEPERAAVRPNEQADQAEYEKAWAAFEAADALEAKAQSVRSIPAPSIPASSMAAQMPVAQRPRFLPAHRTDLVELGVSIQSIAAIERMLVHIRRELQSDATATTVRERLSELVKNLRAADGSLSLVLRSPEDEASREVLGHLGQAASQLEAAVATSGVPSADIATFPDSVDVPTMVRLALLAAKGALGLAPTEQRRREAPWAAVQMIYRAIWVRQPNYPRPTTSKTGSKGMELCSIVFDAAEGVGVGGERAAGRASSSQEKGIRGDVERAIRLFIRRTPAAK